MQSGRSRTLASKIPRKLSRVIINPNNTRKMAMFGPRFYTTPEPNFSGLFRLIDDFDRYQGSQGQGQRHHGRHHVQTFTPKFDLKETETAYELHGELPGIAKDNVHIEFTDPQTIVVRGKVERSYTEGVPPAGLVEDAQMSGAITQGDEKPASPKPHQATVEDENEEGSTAQPTPATTATEGQKPAEQQQPKAKYWISERSVGEFTRTFSFPGRVDTDEVKASLDNGILTVTVPKAKKHESHRITIN